MYRSKNTYESENAKHAIDKSLKNFHAIKSSLSHAMRSTSLKWPKSLARATLTTRTAASKLEKRV